MQEAADKLRDSVPGTSLPRQFSQSLLTLLFPTSCPVCGSELTESARGGVCGTCWEALEAWTGAVCSRCGLPLAAGPGSTDWLCGDCRLERPRFDCARSYGIYAGKLRTAILEVKFHRRERLALPLGRLLIGPWLALQAAFGLQGPWLILPVPLHPSRERERGYNQAALLARGFARALRQRGGSDGFQFDRRTLTRNRSTAPQSGLSVQARRENVRGVFKAAATKHLRDRDVILVDDVMTTGATASACAAELKRRGARRVAVLALARATPEFPDVTSRR